MEQTINKEDVKKVFSFEMESLERKLDYEIKRYENLRNDSWVLPKGESVSTGFSLNNTCNIVLALAEIKKLKYAKETLTQMAAVLGLYD